MRRLTYGYLPSHRASLLYGRYQIILLGDRGTCVWTTCPGSLHESITARIRTLDHQSTPWPSHHATLIQLEINGLLCNGLIDTTAVQAGMSAEWSWASDAVGKIRRRERRLHTTVTWRGDGSAELRSSHWGRSLSNVSRETRCWRSHWRSHCHISLATNYVTGRKCSAYNITYIILIKHDKTHEYNNERINVNNYL